jgi:hypothetical protein
MRELIFIASSLLVLLLVVLITGWLLKASNRHIWQSRWVSNSRWLGLGIAGSSLLFLIVGVVASYHPLQQLGSIGAAMVLILSLLLLAALPVSNLIYFVGKRISRWWQSRGVQTVTDSSRRNFLKLTASGFPLAAIGFGSSGIASSFARVDIPRIDLAVKELPDRLDGLTIAHLTDLHLGPYFTIEDLKTALPRIAAHQPDLVVVTGDIADELEYLPRALEHISELAPPLGVYTCIGNHEYYRGGQKAKAILENAPVLFLLESGVPIAFNGHPLYIAGTDDPVTLRPDIDDFMKQTVEKAVAHAPANAFTILLSHRPLALDYAPRSGVRLVLAGHTHGGQIGYNRRSLLDGHTQEKYMWGMYRNGRATLYTSSGMGHWFPFRLGCPAEAPVLTLRHG